MEIVSQTDLSGQQKESVFNLWNTEYPAKLQLPSLADLDDFLNPRVDKMHYLLIDKKGKIQGWACVFTIEEVRSFFIMLSGAVHGKGYGTQLLFALKQDEKQLFGWVIDHNNDFKANGDPYLSPLDFYLKNDFMVNSELRLEIEILSAVGITWMAKKN